MSTSDSRTNYHVVPFGRLWAVKVGDQIVDVDSRQRYLLRTLRLHCREMFRRFEVPSEIHIHGRDGQIRDKDTYGNDPAETPR